LVRGKSLHLKN